MSTIPVGAFRNIRRDERLSADQSLPDSCGDSSRGSQPGWARRTSSWWTKNSMRLVTSSTLGCAMGFHTGRAAADAVDERRVVAVRDLALLLLEVTREERDEAPGRQVGPVLADQQVGGQVTRRPPLAHRRLVGSEPVELVAEQEAFGLGVARHDAILSGRRPTTESRWPGRRVCA